MAGRQAGPITAAATGNGSSTGYLPVADTSILWRGAHGFLKSNALGPTPVVITEILDSTHVGLRLDVQSPGPNYGRMDLSGYLLADSTTLTLPPQFKDESSGMLP